MTTVLDVRSRLHTYSVHIGEGLLEQVGGVVASLGRKGRVLVVTDANVRGLWGATVQRSLEAAGFSHATVMLDPGEEHKTLRTAEAVYAQLVDGGFGRADTVLAVGGGVVGDLAGFVAATYHRGMGFVQVPTTLLAQVDSSIGGKVAVDLPQGKNLVGAFYPPLAVISDTATLTTLPPREVWSGLAEVVKAGFIADVAYVEELERELVAFGQGTLPAQRVATLVAKAAAIKIAVVTQDEDEQGVRMHLNFGHTLGHALEAATGYGPITHGEAVVMGMRVALRLSVEMGRLSATESARALQLLERFPRPILVQTKPSAEAVKLAMARDKKVLAGKLRFVVLDALGKAGIAQLPPELVDEGVRLALEEL